MSGRPFVFHPRVCAGIAPKTEADLLVPAMRILLKHRDFEWVGRILVKIDDEKLLTDLMIALADDPEGLVRALASVPADDWINNTIRRLPRDRLIPMLVTAARSAEAGTATLRVFLRLEPGLCTELCDELVDSSR